MTPSTKRCVLPKQLFRLCTLHICVSECKVVLALSQPPLSAHDQLFIFKRSLSVLSFKTQVVSEVGPPGSAAWTKAISPLDLGTTPNMFGSSSTPNIFGSEAKDGPSTSFPGFEPSPGSAPLLQLPNFSSAALNASGALDSSRSRLGGDTPSGTGREPFGSVFSPVVSEAQQQRSQQQQTLGSTHSLQGFGAPEEDAGADYLDAFAGGSGGMMDDFLAGDDDYGEEEGRKSKIPRLS